jgi:hypothetical protein
MDALVVYPENKDQLAALKAVMKALKITFERRTEIYPDHMINGVKESLKQTDEGKLKPYTRVKDMLKLA